MAFCAVLHFPHPKAKNIKRVHRLVVLPDYQGLGIGTKLLNFVGNIYKQKGYRFRIVTSTPALLYSLKNNNWKLTDYGHMGKQTGNSILAIKLNKTSSSNRITYSFEL